MKDKIKNAAKDAKKFVQDHKVGIAVVVTAIATAKGITSARPHYVKCLEEFLESKGLADEFNNWLPTTES